MIDWIAYLRLGGQMETKDILVDALRAVEAADIPDDLRGAAFAKAVDLISSRPHGPVSQPAAPASAVEDPSGSGLDRIAAKLAVDAEVASQLYYIADGQLEVVVSPGRLAAKASPATKELALLVVAGRQAAGIDAEWTGVDEIRKVC